MEYLLEDAIFATPAHPHWSGSALIDGRGSLVGLGSLLVRELTDGEEINANMFVPIDLLKTHSQGIDHPRPCLAPGAPLAGRVTRRK